MDPSTNSDPLSDFIPDLPQAETSRPCPIKCDLVFQVTNIEPCLGKISQDNDARDPNKKMLKLTWSLLTEAQNVAGSKLVPAGWTLDDYVLLYQPPQAEGKKPFDFTAAVARRYDALFGTTDETRPGDYAKQLSRSVGRKAVLNGEPKEDGVFGWKWEIKKYKVAPAGA